MRDFELAAVAYIAWVLLYHDSYSRAPYSADVKCRETGEKYTFKLGGGLSWAAIDFVDYNHDYHIVNEGKYTAYDFKVLHTYNKNEIRFKKKGEEFEVTDKTGMIFTVKLINNKQSVRFLASVFPKGKLTYDVR